MSQPTAPDRGPVRVVLVDDHAMFRAGVRGELATTGAGLVDVVTVGDCPLDDELRPVVHAAREAVVNVAKHAGTQRADVFAETSPYAVDIFVRDRGEGFDVDAVATDRQGVRNSIVDRMSRHGGRADVRSAPGEGTEVRLHMARTGHHHESRHESHPEPRPESRNEETP